KVALTASARRRDSSSRPASVPSVAVVPVRRTPLPESTRSAAIDANFFLANSGSRNWALSDTNATLSAVSTTVFDGSSGATSGTGTVGTVGATAGAAPVSGSGSTPTQAAPAAVSSAVHCSTSAVREAGSSASWGAAVSPSPTTNTRRPDRSGS